MAKKEFQADDTLLLPAFPKFQVLQCDLIQIKGIHNVGKTRMVDFKRCGFQRFVKSRNERNPYCQLLRKRTLAGLPLTKRRKVGMAVLNYLNGCQMKGIEINQADVAASFQKAVVDVLVEHSMDAVKRYHVDKFAIAGGVASNSHLRAALESACSKQGVKFFRPSPILCTDNAAMIGAAGYYEYLKGVRHGWDLNAVPNLKLGERI